MWLILSILTALFYSSQGAWSKKISGNISSFTVTWSMFAFAIPFLILPVVLTGAPDIDPRLYYGGISSIVLNMVAVTLYVYALKISQLSTCLPLLTFTPVFLIGTSFLLLGELPSIYGLAGIILISLGTYMLNLNRISDGFLGPLKAIKEDKGAMLMLAVAFIWSFAANFDKIGVLGSGPLFYSLFFNTGFFVLYIPFLFKLNPRFPQEIRGNFIKLFFVGFLGAMMFLTQMAALNIALVSYVIAIKRAGIIFSLIFGGLYFNEKITIHRIGAVLMMLAGVFLISLFN